MLHSYSDIEEFFIEHLFADPNKRATRSVCATIETHTHVFASTASYAFAQCATNIEDGLFGKTHHAHVLSTAILKAVALFAADMFGAETYFRRRITCGDVMAFWLQTQDPVFLPHMSAKKEGDRSPPF